MNLATRRLIICLSLALAAHAGLFAAAANVDLTPAAIPDRTLTVTFSSRPTQQSVTSPITSPIIAHQAQVGDDERSQLRRERQTAMSREAMLDSPVVSGERTPQRLQRHTATAAQQRSAGGRASPRPAQAASETAQSRLTRSARQDPRAAYLVAWRRRVERYGNRHYPGRLIAQAPRHRLTLGVTLRADGSLRAVRVLQSSGSTALDRAAQQIVRNAGPFAALPAAIRARQPSLTFAYDWIFGSAS